MGKINSKVVVFAREEDVLASKYEDNYSDVISKDIILLSNEEIPEFNRLHNVLGNKKVSNNSILISHPFKENYFLNIEDNDEFIQREKLNNTAHLAQLLGAKKFEVISIFQEENTIEVDFEANGKLKLNSLGFNRKKNTDEKTEREYKLINKYPGSNPDYKKALEKLNEYGLTIDSEVKALVESRNPSNVNLLSSQIISFKTASEINENLDIAANLVILGGVLDISSNFHKRISSRKSLELTIKIEF